MMKSFTEQVARAYELIVRPNGPAIRCGTCGRWVPHEQAEGPWYYEYEGGLSGPFASKAEPTYTHPDGACP